jgi:hypothetical protein
MSCFSASSGDKDAPVVDSCETSEPENESGAAMAHQST